MRSHYILKDTNTHTYKQNAKFYFICHADEVDYEDNPDDDVEGDVGVGVGLVL